MGKKATADFVDNYCLVYEEVMTCQEARVVFKEYLKKSMAEEPLLFLEVCEKYKLEYVKLKEKLVNASSSASSFRRSSTTSLDSTTDEIKVSGKNHVTNLFVNLKGIIEEFIVEEAPKELNLSSVRHWTIAQWQEIEGLMNDFEQDSSNVELLSNLYERIDIP